MLLGIPLDTWFVGLKAELRARAIDFFTTLITAGLTALRLPNDDTVGQAQIDDGDIRIKQLMSILHFRQLDPRRDCINLRKLDVDLVFQLDIPSPSTDPDSCLDLAC